MLSFFAGAFAVAGAVAAAGPVVIHLLNRRRYRVVNWAAMDFLREALQRNRRILQLRDLLLLALRTLCVLLFGLAMARPYFSRTSGAIDPDQPVHAVLIVDNSLSMGYEQLDGILLDEARGRAREFIDRLPAGSRISVLPLCGADHEFSWDPFRTKDDASAALARIELCDRIGSLPAALDLAAEACKQAPDLPAKRVVLIGDQQRINWPSESLSAQLKRLPELQVVQINRPEPENAWISDFRLQDGIADVETTASFLATVRYEGANPRPNVQVTLTIDGVTAASKTIDLQPGQEAEVSFPYRFEAGAEPGQATFAAAEVSLGSSTPDPLPADDRRYLMAPVVSALPVLFVDQYGEDEDPKKNQYGDTFLLRRLLAPVTTRGDFGRQLIQIRHKKIEDLVDPQLLQDARLVIIAGVPRPDPAVALLRDYVRQGGQLVIAAGGSFDPAAWNSAAWLDGAGILPAPLKPEAIGQLPGDSTQRPTVFQLAFDTLVHDYFLIENEDREALSDLYGVPVFFKAVAADVNDEMRQQLLSAETKRLREEAIVINSLREKIEQTRAQQAAAGSLEVPGNASLTDDERELDALVPNWLLWSQPELETTATASAEDLARRSLPRVLGAFTNKLPFLIERQIGKGQVLLFTSGVFTNASGGGWNNLAATDAVLLFDRVFRSLLERSLPRRNLDSAERLTLPIRAAQRRNRFMLERPGGEIEPLSVDALLADQYGLNVRNTSRRGFYRITAYKPESAEFEGRDAEAKVWEETLAVNGPQQESELAAVDASTARERLGDSNSRWVSPGDSISLEGAPIAGQDIWKWFMAAVLVCLLVELAVLAWPVDRSAASVVGTASVKERAA